MSQAPPWTIVGQGLAGTCLAWELWKRRIPFQIVDREAGGSSRVAAGLVNPVTGRNFQPSKRVAEFLPEAVDFYQSIEDRLSSRFWHPLPVLRLAATDDEWLKMREKSRLPEVARWLARGGAPVAIDGWCGALELTGGGRLDTRTFLDGSRGFFQQRGIYRKLTNGGDPDGLTVRCEGAAGLVTGRYGGHRCAKGEILTLRATAWDESGIRIGAGGWLVPLGHGIFKAGSTYEWDDLDETPTREGLRRVSEIVRQLGGPEFDIIAHEAGVRPILRRSEPLIGPMADGTWMFNGLGSKGSLYAPGMARRLADWLADGIEPEPEFDFRRFTSR